MKKYVLITTTILTIGVTAIQARAQEQIDLTQLTNKIGYAIGVNIGNDIKRRSVEPGDVNLDAIVQGLKDTINGPKTLLTDTESMEVLREFTRVLSTRTEERRKAEGEKNKTEGPTYLAANKDKEGVVTLPSGLQYKVLSTGSGPKPKATDKVRVHYKGTFINGTQFDSSYDRGQPAEFMVNGVIKGWTEALQLMTAGSKWQLTIPSDLAYGDPGRPGIPPNSVLLFDVELLEVLGAPAPPKPPAPVTSDIIKVPSKEEMEKGAKIEVIKAEDLPKYQEKQTQPAPK